jgi:hypothetical protein
MLNNTPIRRNTIIIPVVSRIADIKITFLELLFRIVSAMKLGISGKRHGEKVTINPRKR